MGKFKVSQDNRTPAQKNTQIIVKKQRKIKRNKGSLNIKIHKDNLETVNASNEIAKGIFTSTKSNGKKRKYDSKNGFAAEKVSRYPKDNKEAAKISQKVQSNRNNKINYKKENKRKLDINPNCTNFLVKANVSATKRSKKEQMCIKKPINLKHDQVKIQNVQKMNERKMEQLSTKTEVQQKKIVRILKVNNRKINVNRLKALLKGSSQTKKVVQPLTLRERMMIQLRASRFRFINETLYNNESSESKRYFKEDPDAFEAYHDGYKQQLEQWPINPLDMIISSIRKMPKDNIIADFGCGEARLADSVPHKVHSFDLIALNDKVKACDMAHTPLLMNSVHIVVFCLSLMGSNLNDYIIEANRVLKDNGILKIAEVESRFENVKNFMKLLGKYGFKNIWKDLSHNMFYFMDFKKMENISMKRATLPPIALKSCLYKKR